MRYKCGHESKPIFIDRMDTIKMVEYVEWEDTYGFNGDKSLCFDCYLKMIKKRGDEE